MKRLLLIISGTLLTLSCAKFSPSGTEDAQREYSSICATLPGVTKTVLGEKTGSVYPQTWKSGDVIYAGGVASDPLPSARAGKARAEFSFSAGVKPPFNITYGGSSGADDLITIPTTQLTNVPQHYSETYSPTFSSGAAPMWAVSQGGSDVTFNHLGAVLRIPITGDSDSRQIRHITITSDGGEAIAGMFRLGKTGGILDGTMTPVGGATAVNVICSTGYTTLSTSGVRVYIAVVAPGTYSGGITATVVALDGSIMVLHAFSGQTLRGGVVYEYPAVVFKRDDNYDIVIQNESQLKSFYTKLRGGQKALNAVIVKDITVKNPASTWPEPVNGFIGKLDGGGHTVSGLTCPMFNELTGSVENLVLKSDIVETLPCRDTLWCGILARRIFNGGFVKNCVTKGSVRVSHSDASSPCVGGMVGYMVRACLKGCVNEASVSLTTAQGVNSYVGGLVGRIYSGSEIVEISGSVSRGDVVLRGTSSKAYAGGIVGNITLKNEANTLSDCINFSDVSLDMNIPSTNAEICIGGIAGYSSLYVRDSRNIGNVSVKGSYACKVNRGEITGK